MKLKIKVKRLNKNLSVPEIIEKGEWVDLRAAETVAFKAPQATVEISRKRNNIGV